MYLFIINIIHGVQNRQEQKQHNYIYGSYISCK